MKYSKQYYRNVMLEAGVSVPAVDKVLATTANLVDVFVYDTRNDSDGGAWRGRENSQSWYTESLNTATRGSKREFPKVALIVAETTKVTIYDATALDCPMWMVFNANQLGASIFATGSSPISAVCMINGIMIVGVSTAMGCICTIDFLNDTTDFRDNTTTSKYRHYTISSRNDNTGVNVTSFYTAGLVNRAVNDVAMTTISRTENAFGILDPVIAVATDGGVSVIDGPAGVGTVVDITAGSGNSYKSVKFSLENEIIFYHVSTKEIGILPIPSVDVPNYVGSPPSGARRYDDTLIPAVWTTASYLSADQVHQQALPNKEIALIRRETGNSETGFTKLQEESTTINGMVAYVTNSYNTGWLKGGIRRAVICEAEGTTETLANLVTNGTFDSDTGWTKGLGCTISGGVANFDGSNASVASTYQEPVGGGTLVAGKRYSVTYTLSGYGASSIYVGLHGAAATLRSANGTYTEILTKVGSANRVNLQASAGFIGSIDNVIVTEVIEDRSVKASALTVNGSLTRSPVATGAELQAVSGLSASSYLSQAYSADLDFGTGDFYACGWLKENPNSVEETIFERAYWNGSAVSGSAIRVNVSSGGLFNITITDDGFTTFDSANSADAIDNSIFQFLVAQRVGSKLQVFLNTVKKSDVTISNAVASLSNANATIRVGLRNQGTVPLTNGSIALLRIGAGSLSEDQIAKMYADELPMFQGNAKCTIQGASSAVTALAYNERYQKLLVGTSAGVTVFNGLATDPSFYTNSGSIKALASDRELNLCATTANVVVKKR